MSIESAIQSNHLPGLISFRMDWLDLLAVHGILESSPTPKFKSISSSMLIFLYGSILTSIHHTWKNHSFDYPDLCQQSNVSAFKYTVLVDHSFSSKEQAPFNFMAAVTIYSDFGAPKNTNCHCFQFFPICQEVMGPNAMILAF